MSLDSTFAALADPTRRAIVSRLGSGPATVSEVAAPFEMSLPAVLKHLVVLENGGLITKVKHGRTVTCTLNADGLRSANEFLTDYESFWSAGMDRLESLLRKENP